MKRLLVAVTAATFQLLSTAVAQTPSMVPAQCVGTSAFAQMMIARGGGPMMPCVSSGGGPPTCTNSLDLSKACNSANLDLL